jgi:hypothetical protein
MEGPHDSTSVIEAAQRARVEDRIRDAKDTGLRNLPCGDFDTSASRELSMLP